MIEFVISIILLCLFKGGYHFRPFRGKLTLIQTYITVYVYHVCYQNISKRVKYSEVNMQDMIKSSRALYIKVLLIKTFRCMSISHYGTEIPCNRLQLLFLRCAFVKYEAKDTKENPNL